MSYSPTNKSKFLIESYNLTHLGVEGFFNNKQLSDEEEIIKQMIQTLFSLKHLSKHNIFTIETTDKTIHTIKFNKLFMEKLFDFISDELSAYIKQNYNQIEQK